MEQYEGIIGKWEFSKKEKVFIDYCIKNNYQIIECKQYISKTKWKFKITENIIYTWETMNDALKFDENQLNKAIALKINLEKMKEHTKGSYKD